MRQKKAEQESLLKPKYWGLWIFVFFAKFFVLLPYKVQMRIGLVIAWCIYPFIKRRKKIALINLQIDFPEKSEEEIRKLEKQSFYSAALAGIESIISWFMSNRRFKKIKFEEYNPEYFVDIHNDPEQVVIVLGFHFHCLEIAGRYTGETYKPFSLIYQKHKNPFFEHIIQKSRNKYVDKCFQRKNILPVIRSLRKKTSLWYAPDQDFGYEHTVFVPFFGKMCSTLAVTSWLVQKTGAKVVPALYARNRDLSGYKIIASKPLENFPTGDHYKDAHITNKILEDMIRDYPEQYLWQHRRFKTRPEGEEKIY